MVLSLPGTAGVIVGHPFDTVKVNIVVLIKSIYLHRYNNQPLSYCLNKKVADAAMIVFDFSITCNKTPVIIFFTTSIVSFFMASETA